MRVDRDMLTDEVPVDSQDPSREQKCHGQDESNPLDTRRHSGLSPHARNLSFRRISIGSPQAANSANLQRLQRRCVEFSSRAQLIFFLNLGHLLAELFSPDAIDDWYMQRDLNITNGPA